VHWVGYYATTVVEAVDHCMLTVQRSPRVPPGVPAAGVEGVDHHVRTAMVSTKPAIERVSSWTRSTGAICTITHFSTSICPSTTRVTGLSGEPGGAQRPGVRGMGG
jgi:hypothetical protein